VIFPEIFWQQTGQYEHPAKIANGILPAAYGLTWAPWRNFGFGPFLQPTVALLSWRSALRPDAAQAARIRK
jgi:hypothetical protein